MVRVNGVLPEISKVGSPDFSKRAADIQQTEFKVNTSCSLFAHRKLAEDEKRYFHLLVDIGEGVVGSLKRGYSQIYDVKTSMNSSSLNTGNGEVQVGKPGTPIRASPVASLIIETSDVKGSHALHS